MTLLLAFILVIAPVIMLGFLVKNKRFLTDPSFKTRFETLYLNLKTDNFFIIFCTFIFLIRRFFFALSIVFLKEYMAFQLGINLLLSAGMTIFMTHSMPYDSKMQNFFELYNEMTILATSLLFLPLAINDISPDTRYTIGYALMAICLLNVLANWTNLMCSVIAALAVIIKRLCIKCWAKINYEPPKEPAVERVEPSAVEEELKVEDFEDITPS
jgi:hypothetical protein